MIDLRKTLVSASDSLKTQGIAHALIGGFALAAYGINRATADIDFLADGTKKKLIIESLQKAGFKLFHETSEILQFQGIGNLDIILANRPMSQSMLSRARHSDRVSVQVAAPEDVIGLKIQAYKNDSTRELQDKADIQNIITNQKPLDWKRIKSYADLFNEWDALKKIGAPDDI